MAKAKTSDRKTASKTARRKPGPVPVGYDHNLKIGLTAAEREIAERVQTENGLSSISAAVRFLLHKEARNDRKAS